MTDNALTGTGVPVATRSVTYSGDAAQNIQVMALATVSGSDDSKTATDLALGNAAMAASLPVTIASNQTVIPVSDNSGSITVDDGGGGGSLTVDNAGTFAVQDSEKIGDNAPFTDGATKVLPTGYILDEVAGTALSENDVAAARIDLKRAQVMVIEDSSVRGRRLTVSSGGGITVAFPAAVDSNNRSSPWGSGTSINSLVTGTAGDYASVLFVIVASAGVTGTPAISFEASYDGSTFVPVYAYDETSLTAAPVTSTGTIVASQTGRWRVPDAAGWAQFQAKITAVPSGGSLTVTLLQSVRSSHSLVQPVMDGGGTLTVDAPVATPVFVRLSDGAAAITALPVTDNSGSLTVDGTVAVAGTVAHDGSTANNPVTVAGRAVAHGANPTAVAAADVTDSYHNRAGVQFVIGGHPNPVMYGMSITTAVSNTIIGPTISSGLKLVVTALTVLLDNASTVFPSVVIGFGTANTPAFATTPGTSKVIAGHPAVPAGGGFTRGDGSGIIGVGADDEELRITTVGTAGGNGLYVLLTGYTIES